MSQWVERILNEFPADLSSLWIVADPDGVLLDEHVLTSLRMQGFEVLPFEDSVVFRTEYEEHYRAAWDDGKEGLSKALVLHLRGTNIDELPWDYLRQARKVSLSLANLFPKLSYGVVRQIDAEYLEPLFEAQARHASQSLGESLTKEYILTHIFHLNPHSIIRPEDLWRELLRLHYRDAALPPILATHVAQVLSDQVAFARLPLNALFTSKSEFLRVVQDAWYQYLAQHGANGIRTGDPIPVEYIAKADIPFDHPDIRVIVDSMFLEGTLHPLAVNGIPTSIMAWAKVGIVQDPAAMGNLVLEGINGLIQNLPTEEASHRDWTQLARRQGEVIARFNGLDTARASLLKDNIQELQKVTDERLLAWVRKHYADLPSLPVVKAPVMVHHVPRYLSMMRGKGEAKVALLVFDGLAVDQWIQIRESIIKKSLPISFEENSCFAWLPTLTSVSRQALFSGLKPREFADTIETTAQEPALWSRFWQDHGLRANEVLYRKSIKRTDQLEELGVAVANPSTKVAGIVIDTIDEIVHGAALGKRGIANQIASWCESGFVEELFTLLLDKGFSIYLTSDHGNVEALGQGRPNQGVAPEHRGERVRTYRNETLAAESLASTENAYRLNIAGLPANYLPLFAGGRTAFVPSGEQIVVHGGVSLEELIVPFIKISYTSK